MCLWLGRAPSPQIFGARQLQQPAGQPTLDASILPPTSPRRRLDKPRCRYVQEPPSTVILWPQYIDRRISTRNLPLSTPLHDLSTLTPTSRVAESVLTPRNALEPQVLPHEAKARESAEAEPTYPPVDSIEDRKYHQVSLHPPIS
jgi:hypothetical protein